MRLLPKPLLVWILVLLTIILIGILLPQKVDANKNIKQNTYDSEYIIVSGSFIRSGLIPPIGTLTNKELGKQIAIKEGYSEKEFAYLNLLIMLEGKWDNEAQNPKSTAYGACQFLNSTWISTGYEKTNDIEVQIRACLIYIKNRYGNIYKAYSFRINNGYY